MNLAVLEKLVSIEGSPLELRRPVDRKRDETVADGIAAANNKTLFINLFLLAECVDENAAEYGGADGAEEHGYLSKRLEMAGDIGSQVGE